MKPLKLGLLGSLTALALGIGAGRLARRFSLPEPPAAALVPPTPTPAPEPFSWEKFRKSTGPTAHRLMAGLLPTADAATVAKLADSLFANGPQAWPDDVWQDVFTRWGSLDPAQALLWARTHDHRDLAMAEWAKRDLNAALAGLDRTNREEWTALLETAVKTEPDRAWKLAVESGMMSRDLEFAMAKANPGAALFPWSGLVSDDAMDFLLNLAREKPAEAEAYARQKYRDEPLLDALIRVAGGMAETDLTGALRLMEEVGWDGETHSPIISETILPSEILQRLANRNLPEAVRLFERLPEADQHLNLSGLTLKWLRQDPEAAVSWLARKNPPNDAFGKSPAELIAEILPPERLLKTAEKFPAGEIKNALLALAIRQGSLADPAASMRMALENLSGSKLDETVGQIARLESVTDPQQAAEHILAGGNTPENFHLKTVVNNWLAADAAGASAWVRDLPPGSTREMAVAALADGLITGSSGPPDAPAALAWALEMHDLDAAEHRASDVLKLWSGADAEVPEIQKILQNSRLSEGCRRELENYLPHPRP